MSLLVLIKDHAYVRDVIVHPDDTPMYDDKAKDELDRELRREGKMGTFEIAELRSLGGRKSRKDA